MNTVLWLVGGGLFGWAACSVLKANAARGIIVSIVIGVVGAFFGGNILTSVFASPGANPGDFSALSVLLALASAAACLLISDRVYEHYGV